MLTTNFVIVTRIGCFQPGEFSIEYDFHPISPVAITFSGNKVVDMKHPINEDTMVEESLYGKVLMAYEMDEIKSLYIILKNKTIFSIDDWEMSEVNQAISQHSVIKDFESLKLI